MAMERAARFRVFRPGGIALYGSPPGDREDRETRLLHAAWLSSSDPCSRSSGAVHREFVEEDSAWSPGRRCASRSDGETRLLHAAWLSSSDPCSRSSGAVHREFVEEDSAWSPGRRCASSPPA